MKFYQGNTYKLPIKLTMNGTLITADMVKTVEFMLGDVRKTYPEDATFDTDSFIVYLSQEDTFKLCGISVSCQSRVLFNDGSCKGTGKTLKPVGESISKVVLE